MTKKLKANTVRIGSSGSAGGFSTNCTEKFSEDCAFCYTSFCIKCNLDAPESDTQYLDHKMCRIKNCNAEDGYGEHCQTCNSGTCTQCDTGYYINDKSCTKCSDHCEECTNQTNCVRCEDGYKIQDGQCVADWCSGSDFMRVSNLCVTRRNMGDSANLTIPNTVTVKPGSNSILGLCSDTYCCWNGKTALNEQNIGICTSTGGDYSGCNRTVCNYNAANEICTKFNYNNFKWRLASESEMSNWYTNYSKDLGNNGLQLCDHTNANDAGNESRCPGCTGCDGANANWCLPGYVWNVWNSGNYWRLASGNWYTGNIADFAESVRCVTDGLTCADGYYKVGSECVSCGANCKSCSSGSTCAECNSGYYLNGSSCSACIANCKACSDDTTCSMCDESVKPANCTTQSSTNCSNCSICNSGYYLNGSFCSACIANCIACSDGTTCSMCNESVKPANCATQSSTNCSKCSICNSGYYVNNSGTCSACSGAISHCTKCTNASTCTECESGYYVNGSNTCSVPYSCNVSNCTTCLYNSPTTCSTCNSGYYLNAGSCSSCSSAMTGCVKCSNASTCTECEEGYYLNGSTCTSCKAINTYCNKCSSGAVCTRCLHPYFEVSNNSCKATHCAPSMIGVQTYTDITCTTLVSNGKVSFCLGSASCDDGYTKISLKTVFVKNAGSCQPQTVSVCSPNDGRSCEYGYYKSGLDCLPCGSNCKTCTNSTTCTECNEGYYLNGSTCRPCTDVDYNCAKCTNANTCTKCKSTYYSVQSGYCKPTNCASNQIQGVNGTHDVTSCNNGTNGYRHFHCKACNRGYAQTQAGYNVYPISGSCSTITRVFYCKPY